MKRVWAFVALLFSMLLSAIGVLAVLSSEADLAWISRTSSYFAPRGPSPDLPPTDIRLQSRNGGVEQVHLVANRHDRVTLVFVRDISSNPDMPLQLQATVRYGRNASLLDNEGLATARVYTGMQEYNSYLWNPPMGAPFLNRSEIAKLMNTASWAQPWWPVYNNDTAANIPENESVKAAYNNPASLYQSPLIFTVKLENLLPNTQYFYEIDGEYQGNFTTLPMDGDHSKPLTLGMWADVGQTNVSALNMEYLLHDVNPDLVLLAGDLSYADAFQQRWDTWGRLMEPLMSHKLSLFCNADHELNVGNEQNIGYLFRYPAPFEESNSPSFEYYSYKTGPLHIIALGSYTVFNHSSVQYRWLEQELARIDRRRTPWVLVMLHVPWYCSNFVHIGEGLLMRESMEPLLYKYGVDIVLTGHVHAYERTFPVYQNETNSCGPVHFDLGDAGNREGAYTDWLMPQPSWSAFREASFGVGKLVIYNETHAYYEWHRVACEDTNATHCATKGDNSAQRYDISDTTWVIRNTSQCPNRLMPNAMSEPVHRMPNPPAGIARPRPARPAPQLPGPPAAAPAPAHPHP